LNQQAEIDNKTERLQKLLDAENLGAVLLNSQHNFAWLSAGKSNAIDLSKENGACHLLVRKDGKRFILANNIEMQRLLSEVISAENFEPVEFSWQDEKSSGDFIIKKAKSLLGDETKIASDVFITAQIPQVENLIARCRYQLTDAEIERYRRLGKDAGIIIGNLFERIKPGETELEIARKTKDALAEFNINSIVTLVGADERIEKYRHPIPTENKWKKTLLVVVCAKREGLIVNLSRIACVGKVPEDLRRRTEDVAYVFAKLLSGTKPETNGAELYQIAGDAYAEKGFANEIDMHHQGGATGYKTRDWIAHPKNQEIVRLNQAFAWNPSITGTKAEETIIITESGLEILTASPGFPYISIEMNGHPWFSPNILCL
jgi:Xaa-Pro dipeptidase